MANKASKPKRIRQYTMHEGRDRRPGRILEILWMAENDGLATINHDGIILGQNLRPRRFWEVCIHEIIHQKRPDMTEHEVDDLAAEIEGFLYALGRPL